MPSKVLIIDDETDVLVLLGMRLRQQGYETLTASCGEDGLQVIKEQRVDVILLDIMMPGIDGYEVLKQLKADPATKNIPVIMVSAKKQAEDIQKAKTLGAADYVGKPIDFQRLLNIIREAVSSKIS